MNWPQPEHQPLKKPMPRAVVCRAKKCVVTSSQSTEGLNPEDFHYPLETEEPEGWRSQHSTLLVWWSLKASREKKMCGIYQWLQSLLQSSKGDSQRVVLILPGCGWGCAMLGIVHLGHGVVWAPGRVSEWQRDVSSLLGLYIKELLATLQK